MPQIRKKIQNNEAPSTEKSLVRFDYRGVIFVKRGDEGELPQ